MPSKFTAAVEAQIIGTIIGGAILLAPAAIFAGAQPLLTAAIGPSATNLVEIVLGGATFLFTGVASYYFYFVLPGDREAIGSPERKRYDHLRADLGNGGTAARIYSEKLTAALKAVERFFRDEGSPGQQAFGLKTPAPLWTSNAFHYCLILALLYPIVTIFFIWAASSEVGAAEASFGLPRDLPWWQRTSAIFGLAFGILSYWRFKRSPGRRSLLWLLLVPISAVLIAYALAGGGAGTVAGSVAVSGAVVGAVAGDIGIGVFGAVVGAVAGAIAFTLTSTLVSEVIGATSVAVVGAVANDVHVTRDRSGRFLLLFVLAMIVACLVSANVLSSLPAWPVVGPLLLFVGLFTLLNAPFLWLSLGVTRALLWRGLERQLWWPYFYAMVDAACAVIVIALLACTMVVGIQAFDFMSAHAGAKSILPLRDLFEGIVVDGFAPKYWWLYALFLSAMIPSLVNLGIGGFALTRGIPRLSTRLYNLMDSTGPVSDFNRIQIAALLGAQVVGGIVLGIAAQTLLAFALFRYAMPSLGIGLLDLARLVANFDLPGRLFKLLP
jgi:hypothetical protein